MQDIAGHMWAQCPARWCNVSSPQAPATLWCSSMRLTNSAEVSHSALPTSVMSCCVFLYWIACCCMTCGFWCRMICMLLNVLCSLIFGKQVYRYIGLPKCHAARLVTAQFAAFCPTCVHDQNFSFKVQMSGHQHYLPRVQA